jgi:predicted ATPase
MDYIEIAGYKSIQNEKIELKPINLLIGANGSGKSNFMLFFDFLNHLYNRTLNEYVALNGGENKVLHKGQKVSDKISFKVEFDNGKNGYAVDIKLGTEGFIFTEERFFYNGDAGIDISRSEKEARIKITDNFRAKHLIKYLNGFRKYHFHDTSNKSPFSTFSHIENDAYYLYSDGANLAAFLYAISQNDQIVYNRIVRTIRSIAPFFMDFDFLPNRESFIKLHWKDKFSDIVYGATDLSDGTLRFIALTVLFLQPNLPDTIIIDEPELGLHPLAIAKLAGMIQSASKKNCQIIVATQSTDLISHFSPDSIITVDQIDGCSKFKRLDANELQEWFEDYTIDDLWKRNIITTGHPNF